jgi:hypothetical protein
MPPRLASGLLVRALIQQAEAGGGFGTVVHKGEANSGSLFLVLAEKGRPVKILEKILNSNGQYEWQESSSQAVENKENLQKFLSRRKKFDPDSWVLELDVPDTQRFTDSLGTFD